MYKILLIPEFVKYGGTRAYFVALINFYKSQGFDVVVALLKSQLDEAIIYILEKNKYKYILLPERKFYLKKIWHRMPFSFLFDWYAIICSLFKQKPDLVVISNGTPGYYLGSFFLPIKCLYIMHTYPYGKGMNIALKLLLNSVINNNKTILTVSEYSKNQILLKWIFKKNKNLVRVVYNTLFPNKQKKINSIQPKKTKFRILTLGHLEWYKNPEIWIKIAKKFINYFPDINIEWTWAGDGSLYEKCQFSVKYFSDKIKFIGYVSRVENLYKTSDIYFQPSIMESQGISVLEAMRWRLPCIVSNTGGMPESVINNETGFVIELENVEDIINKFFTLINNKKLRTRMGNAGFSRYKKFFSYKIWEKKMIDLYANLQK